MRKLFLISCMAILVTSGYARKSNDPLTPNTFTEPTKQDQLEHKIPNDLRIKKFYLNIDPNKVKEVIQKDRRNKELFDRFDKAVINHKPVVKPIDTLDEIAVHPYFTTTILLPPGSIISYASASDSAEVLKYNENVLLFRPKKDFEIANIAILYSLNKKNRVLNIIARRFDPKDPRGDMLNIIYSYKDVPKRSGLEVIEAYVKEYGHLPRRNYNYIYIDGVLYRIVKDDKYGDIMIRGNKYRVSCGVAQK